MEPRALPLRRKEAVQRDLRARLQCQRDGGELQAGQSAGGGGGVGQQLGGDHVDRFILVVALMHLWGWDIIEIDQSEVSIGMLAS